MVSGEGFSDGEQHYLPILPNRERVTVTVPFTQTEPGMKTIDLSALKDKTNSQLTVEYTNNPVWLMIQALPTVGHPHDNCAICQASSYYANTIGHFIIQQNPQAKGVFESWSREQGNETSLMSNLQKNQELKDLVLDETPWLADANREQEQKERLADFFDENLMQQRQNSSLDNLRHLQLADGSWSWWPGMDGSIYMTVEVSEMLVRLNQMTTTQDATKQMLTRAFDYMGKEMVKMVDEMKKDAKKGWKPTFPSHMVLQWLYICALDGRQLPANVKEANNYLIRLLKKETSNQSIYDKAMSAIILNNKTYIKSLKEYTVYREDMGRYYDTNRALYSWRDYRIPTQVAAIEAIKRLTPEDTKTIEEMQRWLLQEKRTQAWDTPVNSTEAIYAFLNGNSQSLEAQPKTVLKVDGQELQTSQTTAGIGYVKTTMSGDDKQTFTAEKTSTGTSWGAVYMQFMQPTSEVETQNSGIKVKREMIGNKELKVGDKVTVRITVEADRDYDFVQVVDKRAACMEPVNQLSGYHWGYYTTPKDCATNYYFDLLAKGKHVIETEYYIDRPGTYETGTCTVSCAYSPEFRGVAKSQIIEVK
jgi:sRNA-binding regulator protein Hfq